MNNAIHYFDPDTPAMIIAGKKDGNQELGVFYSGSLDELLMLRDLINESFELLQTKSKSPQSDSRFAA